VVPGVGADSTSWAHSTRGNGKEVEPWPIVCWARIDDD
jgi:hypothetical protein